MAGFEAFVKILECHLSEMRKENEKMMEQRTSAPPSLPDLFVPQVERSRIAFSHRRGVEHPVESCWKLHSERDC